MSSVPSQGGTRKAASIPLACYLESILKGPGMLLPVEGGEFTVEGVMDLDHLCVALSS